MPIFWEYKENVTPVMGACHPNMIITIPKFGVQGVRFQEMGYPYFLFSAGPI